MYAEPLTQEVCPLPTIFLLRFGGKRIKNVTISSKKNTEKTENFLKKHRKKQILFENRKKTEKKTERWTACYTK